MKRTSIWIWILLFAFVPPFALGKATRKKETVTSAEGNVAKGIFLFDFASKESAAVEGTPKPNRVHVRYSSEFNDWVFVLSDPLGRFQEPMEVLVTGSVLSGEQIGAPAYQHYVFQAGGRWLPTKDPKTLRLIVLSQIPSYRTLTYEPASGSRIEFVNPDTKVDFKTYLPFGSR